MTKEDLQYVENKHRGGENNAKGNRFEAFYAVYYILKHFNLRDEDKIYFFPQMKLTFVDDLVISCLGKNTYHQIKNKKGISWGSESTMGTITYDFKKQMAVCVESGEKYALKLVVSHDFETLAGSIPACLDNTSVEFFPYYTNLNRYIYEENFKDEIVKCFGEIGDLSLIENIATVVLGLWSSGDFNGKSVMEFKKTVCNILGLTVPTQIERNNIKQLAVHLEKLGFHVECKGRTIIWSWNQLTGNVDANHLDFEMLKELSNPLDVISCL